METEKLKRILQNEITIIVGRSNSGKTMLLADMMKTAKKNFIGKIWSFGVREEITNELNINIFNSTEELESIENSFIFIDELGTLFNMRNAREMNNVDLTLRNVNHKNNKIILCGLPTDFKKFICERAKCFIFKDLTLKDLTNGSRLAEVIKQYRGAEVGSYLLTLPKDEYLGYDSHYFKDKIEYYAKFDTKKNNINILQQK